MTAKIKKYIIALDQGTTSCRSILFDENQKIVAVEQKEFKQIMPQSGWVEHDPIEILETQNKTLQDLIEKSDLIKTEKFDEDFKLYIKEGKEWMRNKYGFKSKWDMIFYAKSFYNNFFKKNQSHIKYKI